MNRVDEVVNSNTEGTWLQLMCCALVLKNSVSLNFGDGDGGDDGDNGVVVGGEVRLTE